jgi:hypothetical protein
LAGAVGRPRRMYADLRIRAPLAQAFEVTTRNRE